nr:DUF1661 domain-containing protein [Porphyromonas gulae]
MQKLIPLGHPKQNRNNFFSSRKRPNCGSCFGENSRVKNFAPARKFFSSRAKTKKFSRHVFQTTSI